MGYGWQDQGFGGGGWFAMVVMMVLFWGLLAVAVVYIVRHFSHPHQASAPATNSAIETLKMRFAKGEMDEEEFKRRLDLLKGES